MNYLAQIFSFVAPFIGILEPIALNLEQNTVMPELNALIENVSSPDLKLALQGLATFFDNFAQAEIKKLV